MFFRHGLDVIDFDLDLLAELLAILDHQIALIEVQISQSDDPDALGHLDRMERTVGLGFVACQQYINSTYLQLERPGQKKWNLLESPPRHVKGRSFAAIVDAAANYWKHHGEWPSPHEAMTRKVIDSITPSQADYVLGNLLVALVCPEPPRFASIVHRLKQWRDLQIE